MKKNLREKFGYSWYKKLNYEKDLKDIVYY